MPGKLAIFLLYFLVAGSSPARRHPFYLSVTEFNYNSGTSRWEVTVKLFTNDLEDALAGSLGKRTDLINVTDTSRTISMLENYLGTRLNLSVSGSPVSVRILGFENEEEATWIYLESQKCPRPGKMEIHNSLLCDFLSRQMNIVHVKVGDRRKSSRLNCPDSRLLVDF